MGGADIAIVGIGLRYPDSASPGELWENVLAGRRAFRALPPERMNPADYYSPDPAAPDRFYSAKAAVLRDFHFDRGRYQVAGSTYRSTDLTHWLALDTAARALADAGFPDGADLPRPRTGVVVGNSLTGEFSRANIMRLRWPYVRRTLAAALADKGWDETETTAFLRELEPRYKAPFPAIDEDSLAGGLANTIAGRVCNHYDLGGGGYTVDGACSSSLLAITTAGKALADGDLDVAIAGGVDLSIDPFEVIGFAKTGALATGEMKVYDRDSNGFWPGEGCGMLVLMRESDALERGARIYATIAGWGVSSDGKGGITRPEASGHQLAIARAYERAGYGVETVSYFEGHGTGTAVGDATEIEALSGARRAAAATAPAALGTVKGNFGHTKAAAGVAGLIKAALAVHHRVIPPGTGHRDPHPGLLGPDAALYVPAEARPWPEGAPARAGVSALGFGGINTHLTLRAAAGSADRSGLDERTTALVRGRQDAELLLFDGEDTADVRAKVSAAAEIAPKLAEAELTDLAAGLAAGLAGRPVRAAVVVTSAADAERKLAALLDRLAEDGPAVTADGTFLGRGSTAPRVAFLFPGQGSGRGGAGALPRRFAVDVPVAEGADLAATEHAQPRIVSGSLAGLSVLDRLGVRAEVAVGHSLGELTALHWGGALSAEQVLRLAGVRGEVMARASRGGGAMASIGASPERVAELAGDADVVVAGYNGPHQTVISGPADDVDAVRGRAAAAGVAAVRLPVSHAFHSPLVRPAAEAMAGRLAEIDFAPLAGRVVSTVTAADLAVDTDLRSLLVGQITGPVHFHAAAAQAAADADIVLEVGPGRVLTGLLAEIAPDTPALAVETDSPSITPLLSAVGAVYALGAPVDIAALFAGRLTRPLPADGAMSFLASPCETAPALAADVVAAASAPAAETAPEAGERTGESTVDLLRRLAAERVELPVETIHADTHPLDDLHLSSITVGQLVNDATRALGLPSLGAAPNYATVRLGELAALIDELSATADDRQDSAEAPGVAAWVRPLALTRVPAELPAPATAGESGEWAVFAPDGHPLAEPLRAALSAAGVGAGVLLCLPGDGEQVDLTLTAGKAAVAAGTRFVVLQGRYGAAGLARTLHLEHPGIATTVVTAADVTDPALVDAVVAEVAATRGFSEAHLGPAGRTVPVLTPVVPDPAAPTASPLGTRDVLLVTGGGKGITAECALAVAQDSGAALALVGRADPARDAELAGNLARMRAAGVRFHYATADVTDAAAVRDAVAALETELGPVTAVLHGAGRNEPAALATLDADRFHRTVAPKVDGLRAVLDAVDHDRIKLLITFGSIIGRAGLRGEAHYSTANDWMSELTVRFGEEHPNARVLALEWSVWSGAGMGEKLGVVEALMREGITPISTDDGIAVLRTVLADPGLGPVLVVSGRTGPLPTITLPRPELPLHRFLDRVLVHYPGVELVTEVDLAAGSDPYLDDHLLDGDLLFPAVLGMEAMAQVAAAVTGRTETPVLTDMEFLRPIAVRPGSSTTVRVAALVRDRHTVDVVIRSAETGYSADHFRAVLRLDGDRPTETRPAVSLPAIPVDPITELYGGVMFQGKRFQRLLGYRKAAARHAIAEIGATGTAPWFAPYLSQELLLADPGARDAVMHALQACVPNAILLPLGIERLVPAAPADVTADYLVLDARERGQDGDSYTYDIDVRLPDGTLVEHWAGLTLRAVRKRGTEGPWTPALLGSLFERGAEHHLGSSRAVVVEPVPAGPAPAAEEHAALAVARVLDPVEGARVASAHGAGMTMVVVGAGEQGCAVTPAVDRTEAEWARLLGPTGLALRDEVAAATAESPSVAGARVAAAFAATGVDDLVLVSADDGWVVLAAGAVGVATWATTLRDRTEPVVLAAIAAR